MKWFEHRTTDRNELEARLLKKKFGFEGYGLWLSLIEVIGEYMENDNISEWGFVPKDLTMEQIAEKVGCSEPQFRLFVEYCDAQLILEERDGRMFCPYILERMNEYAQRIHSKLSRKSKKTEITDDTDDTEIPETTKKPALHTQHNTITTQSHKEIAKAIKAPKAFGDPKVNLVLELFQEVYGFKPIDKNPRFPASNLVKAIEKLVKSSATNLDSGSVDDRVRGILKTYFTWVKSEKSLGGAKNMYIVYKNFDYFYSTQVERPHAV